MQADSRCPPPSRTLARDTHCRGDPPPPSPWEIVNERSGRRQSWEDAAERLAGKDIEKIKRSALGSRPTAGTTLVSPSSTRNAAVGTDTGVSYRFEGFAFYEVDSPILENGNVVLRFVSPSLFRQQRCKETSFGISRHYASETAFCETTRMRGGEGVQHEEREKGVRSEWWRNEHGWRHTPTYCPSLKDGRKPVDAGEGPMKSWAGCSKATRSSGMQGIQLKRNVPKTTQIDEYATRKPRFALSPSQPEYVLGVLSTHATREVQQDIDNWQQSETSEGEINRRGLPHWYSQKHSSKSLSKTDKREGNHGQSQGEVACGRWYVYNYTVQGHCSLSPARTRQRSRSTFPKRRRSRGLGRTVRRFSA